MFFRTNGTILQIAKDVLQFAKDPFEFAGDVLEANFGIFGVSNEPNCARFCPGKIATCILKIPICILEIAKCHLKSFLRAGLKRNGSFLMAQYILLQRQRMNLFFLKQKNTVFLFSQPLLSANQNSVILFFL